jgi:hypothetical protein
LVIGAVIVDYRCGPEHDFNVVRVKIVNKCLRVREEGFVPDKIIVASSPSRIDVKASERDLIFHIILSHLHDCLLILSVIIPDNMCMGPFGVGRF